MPAKKAVSSRGRASTKAAPPPPPAPTTKPAAEEEEDFEDELQHMDALTLASNDGYLFVVDKRTAMISQTIRNMLYGGGNFEEQNTKVIRLNNIRSVILEKIIEYWHYRSQYSDHIDQLPEFKIDPSIAIELLSASEYLQT